MSTDVHSLIGPYVLDAVDDDERELMERHLAECDVCVQEVRELRETVTRMSADVTTTPPDRVGRSILEGLDAIRQEPPLSEHSVVRSYRRRWGRRTHRTARILSMVAAAMVIAIVSSLLTTWLTTPPLEESDRIAAVLGSPDVQIAQENPESGGTVIYAYSTALDQGAAIVNQLGEPGENRTYQLWRIEGDDVASAGVLHAGDTSARFLLTGFSPDTVLGVTNEPAGGSASPTLPTVATVSLQ